MGLRYDPDMVRVAVKNRVPVCLMHNRKTVDYKDFYKDFINDMKECIRIALDAGISKDDIILDPGIGFGKTYEMNLYLLNHLKKLHELGFLFFLVHPVNP